MCQGVLDGDVGELVKVQWGETEYGIGSFPLGGYVKMLGQDDNPGNAEEEADRTKIRDEHGNVRLDPRSYPAKSVPQRMAIISAGVIMNIIFGVIFAAIAYKMGVEIQPAVVGSTTPGDPAWKANLQIGDRIVQVGRNGYKNEHMRFFEDMSKNLFLYGDYDKDLEVLVRHPDGNEDWLTMRPSSRLKDGAQKGMPGRPTLGLTNGRSLEFGKLPTETLPLLGPDLTNIAYVEQVKKADGKTEQETEKVDDFAELQAAMRRHATLDFKLTSKLGKGDKLVAVNGEPVATYADVQRLLAANAGKTIELTVQRAPKKKDNENVGGQPDETPEQYMLKVGPRPAVDYGIVMQATPITAVQKDSPAAKAGVQAGDKLLSFAGEPIGDPLSFPQRTLARIGETVEIELERGEEGKAETHKLTVELRQPLQTMWSGSISSTVAVETLGIAYDVTAKVAQVREDGPATGKLLPGDEIVAVKFLAAGPAQEAIEGSFYRKAAVAKEEIKLDGKAVGWPGIVDEASVQRMRDTTLQVTVKRGQEEITENLLPVDSTDLFIEDLNLPFSAVTEKHVAANWGEALSLGAREVKERMTEVFTVVTKLVTGRISATNLGGPLAIIGQATHEADQGITDLLMFFTFLSANLAVINFLPIPALDGGHMVFLAYEGIRRKPVDENLQMRLSAAGILSLLALMLFVTMLDLYRFFG